MVTSITIRNVPEEVRDELAALAARSGRSLQEYLLIQFEDMASLPSAAADDVVAQVRARVAATGTELSVADVLAARSAACG